MANDKQSDEVFCRSCGEPIKKEAEICPECGVRNTARETASRNGGIDVEEALTTGFERVKARSGLLLVAVFFVIQLVSTVASQSGAERAFEQMGGVESLPPFVRETMVQGAMEPTPLAFDIPQSVITLMSLLTAVGTIVAGIAAYRVFASDARERIPPEAYRRNIGTATLNGIVAGFVFGILVAIGIVLLVVPGIYLITALIFFMIFVALEDENFLESLSSSWELTEGRRISVFLLLMALLVVQVAVGIVGLVASSVAGAVLPQLGAVVDVAVGAALAVYSLAVLTDAYFQLKRNRHVTEEPPV
ncbi:hypothetical protein EGH25_02655 [Haladaptatus sp. F3-133]|jgi:predicted RNA-binding Zn-ribbon protein involved in translation (DUF1610 family)|uniref:DUF7847 domain-containing protein n=1 Tax=Halorutilus salinus TaxID=2487751 RepID=A0A9Q4C364_9EURY|nr:hypothetical protein [Halorutilus salinus]MCX2818252.1 hypothetical protein [Halorutilus salinus]